MLHAARCCNRHSYATGGLCKYVYRVNGWLRLAKTNQWTLSVDFAFCGIAVFVLLFVFVYCIWGKHQEGCSQRRAFCICILQHLYICISVFCILYLYLDICYLLRGGEHWEGWSERRRAQHHWQITFLFLFTTSASTLIRVISNAAIIIIIIIVTTINQSSPSYLPPTTSQRIWIAFTSQFSQSQSTLMLTLWL